MRPSLFALAVVLAACGSDTPDPIVPGGPPAGTDSVMTASASDTLRPTAPGSRPETATASIQIEGTEEAIDLRLVVVDDVPLPFSTYIPADWRDDVVGSGEGTAVRFTTGEPPDEGVVTVFVPSEPNRAGIEALARAVAESNGGAEPLAAPEPWVRAGYTFSDGARAGSVRVGERAGVPFYVLVQYPVEWGDRFAPRAALVLDRLRWADDGTALGG